MKQKIKKISVATLTIANLSLFTGVTVMAENVEPTTLEKTEAEETIIDEKATEIKHHHDGEGHHGNHMSMEHNRNEDKPENMTEAQAPKFPVGSKVIVTDAHMDLMKDVEAEVTGAYDTTLYIVTYGEGDNKIEDHKWVVHEEIEGDKETYKIGDEVTLKAKHMEGMEGEAATITGMFRGPAYMISFEPNDDSEPFTNHKWVSETEISSLDQTKTE